MQGELTAEEARRLTSTAQNTIQDLLNEAFSIIRRKANEGFLDAKVYVNTQRFSLETTQSVERELENRGYEVFPKARTGNFEGTHEMIVAWGS